MNRFNRNCSFVVLASLAGVAALGFHDGIFARSAPRAEFSQRSVIDQPSHWVPFSAELKRIHERNGTTFIGRYYRNADGSTRNETGRSLEAIDIVGIKNVQESTYYNWTPEGGWTSQPMVLPPQGWIPFETYYFDGVTDVSDTVEGFKLVRRLESNGRVSYQAPQLNMFTLVTLVKCNFDTAATCGTWYSSIKLEEPAVDFSPPKGTLITESKEPGGIIWKPGQ